jgi:hypothetical protein
VKAFLNRHSLVIGLILMFLYTWTIDLANSGVLPFEVPFPIYITLGWGFIFASLLMTWLTLSKDETVITFCLKFSQQSPQPSSRDPQISRGRIKSRCKE